MNSLNPRECFDISMFYTNFITLKGLSHEVDFAFGDMHGQFKA